jgi:nucleoside transporter
MRRFGLLFVLMFLEYAIWGAWLPVAGTYFQGQAPSGLGFSGMQLGVLFALMPACSIFMSPIFGQLADRVFHSEKLLATLQLLSAVALFALSRQTTFAGTFICLLIHCLLFSPTMALCNSVVMGHLDDPSKQFANIRVAGTVGWLLSNWALFGLRSSGKIHLTGDLFVIAAVLSVILGISCFFLPKTPPNKTDANRYAFGKAFQLMKNPNFMMLMIVSLVICTQFDFFYMFTPGYLTAPTQATLSRVLPESYLQSGGAGLGVSTNQVSLFMSLAQISEFVLMLCLPFLLAKLGFLWTLFLGIVAWFVRFLIYVLFASLLATSLSILLHGFCFACFLAAGSIYVAKVAPTDIRASAQSLYFMVTFGFGRFFGAIFGGYIETMNTTKLPVHIAVPGLNDLDKLVNWQAVFAVPTGITFACVLAFPFLFRPKAGEPS